MISYLPQKRIRKEEAKHMISNTFNITQGHKGFVLTVVIIMCSYFLEGTLF